MGPTSKRREEWRGKGWAYSYGEVGKRRGPISKGNKMEGREKMRWEGNPPKVKVSRIKHLLEWTHFVAE